MDNEHVSKKSKKLVYKHFDKHISFPLNTQTYGGIFVYPNIRHQKCKVGPPIQKTNFGPATSVLFHEICSDITRGSGIDQRIGNLVKLSYVTIQFVAQLPEPARSSVGTLRVVVFRRYAGLLGVADFETGTTGGLWCANNTNSFDGSVARMGRYNPVDSNNLILFDKKYRIMPYCDKTAFGVVNTFNHVVHDDITLVLPEEYSTNYCNAVSPLDYLYVAIYQDAGMWDFAGRGWDNLAYGPSLCATVQTSLWFDDI